MFIFKTSWFRQKSWWKNLADWHIWALHHPPMWKQFKLLLCSIDSQMFLHKIWSAYALKWSSLECKIRGCTQKNRRQNLSNALPIHIEYVRCCQDRGAYKAFLMLRLEEAEVYTPNSYQKLWEYALNSAVENPIKHIPLQTSCPSVQEWEAMQIFWLRYQQGLHPWWSGSSINRLAHLAFDLSNQ